MAGTHGLPSGTLPDTGLILRHYDDPDRRALAAAFGQACRARGIVFLVAGDWRLALACGADGLHLPSYLVARRAAWKTARSDWIVTAAVHTMGDAMRAWRSGVDGVLVSPVFPTRSHPGAPALGPLAAARLAAAFPGPVFALGGMDEGRWRRLAPLGFAGWAGIGAWTPASPAGDAE
ncbi:MAG: thiamine phosphate synthase [Alphaproteobacteria bacterium]